MLKEKYAEAVEERATLLRLLKEAADVRVARLAVEEPLLEDITEAAINVVEIECSQLLRFLEAWLRTSPTRADLEALIVVPSDDEAVSEDLAEERASNYKFILAVVKRLNAALPQLTWSRLLATFVEGRFHGGVLLRVQCVYHYAPHTSSYISFDLQEMRMPRSSRLSPAGKLQAPKRYDSVDALLDGAKLILEEESFSAPPTEPCLKPIDGDHDAVLRIWHSAKDGYYPLGGTSSPDEGAWYREPRTTLDLCLAWAKRIRAGCVAEPVTMEQVVSLCDAVFGKDSAHISCADEHCVLSGGGNERVWGLGKNRNNEICAWVRKPNSGELLWDEVVGSYREGILRIYDTIVDLAL